MRFSLYFFLMLIAIVGAALGVYGRHLMAPVYQLCQHELSTSHGSRYWCASLLIDGTLDYCVICPRSVDFNTWKVTSSRKGGTSNLSVRGDGLFVNNERLSMDSLPFVYVYTVDRSMRPIELADAEYAQIKDGVDPMTRVWKTKIEPVIDEEYHRGPDAKCMHPDCPAPVANDANPSDDA